MKVALISGRGSSERIPRKNIKPFCGKPIIAWSIETASESGLFDRIIVSTDDDEIANIAKDYGAEVPFIRPKELASHHANNRVVIKHAINWMLKNKWEVETLCLMYPTSVFCNSQDLHLGLSALESGKWTYAFSATNYGYPIFRSFYELKEGGVEMFFPENVNKRSQDLPVAYHDAAQFYWGNIESWLNDLKMFMPHSYTVKIPNWRVVDIDNNDDWIKAELMFQTMTKRSS